MINPRQKVETPSQPNWSEDLTLTGQAPIAFCVRFLLQQLELDGRQERLFELFGNDPRGYGCSRCPQPNAAAGFH